MSDANHTKSYEALARAVLADADETVRVAAASSLAELSQLPFVAEAVLKVWRPALRRRGKVTPELCAAFRAYPIEQRVFQRIARSRNAATRKCAKEELAARKEQREDDYFD